MKTRQYVKVQMENRLACCGPTQLRNHDAWSFKSRLKIYIYGWQGKLIFILLFVR